MSRREKIQAVVRWIVGGGELILVVGGKIPVEQTMVVGSTVSLDRICETIFVGSGSATLPWVADHLCSNAVSRLQQRVVRVYATRGEDLKDLLRQIKHEVLYLRAEEVSHGRGAPATTPLVNVTDLPLVSGDQLSIKYDAENNVITTKTSRS